eukprot:3591116-Rhodomonas_salina.1
MRCSQPVSGALMPGHRGIEMQTWFDRGCTGFDDFRDTVDMSRNLENETLSETLSGLFESPTNIQGDREDGSGPVGRFRCSFPTAIERRFFRAPVTAKYTFMTASDDQSELWIGRTENNATDLELVIESEHWANVRDFSKDVEGKGEWYGGYNLEWRATHHKSRTSRPIAMQKGEFRFLEAWYRSCGGGDNMAVAAVLHESTVNRKDTPFGVDEKQQVNMEVQAAQLQIVN